MSDLYFWKYLIQVSVREAAILTEGFMVNGRIVNQVYHDCFLSNHTCFFVIFTESFNIRTRRIKLQILVLHLILRKRPFQWD
jgi:hypothetical protein